MKEARTKEYVALVDENDRPVGKLPRAYADNQQRRENWIRISAVLIKNNQGKILLQQRSGLVVDPLKWTDSAGGKVDFGESYLNAAKRELKEELGIKTKLRKVLKYKYHRERKHIVLFIGKCNGPFRLNREVRQIKFFSIGKIKSMVKESPKKFKRGFATIITKHVNVIENA